MCILRRPLLVCSLDLFPPHPPPTNNRPFSPGSLSGDAVAPTATTTTTSTASGPTPLPAEEERGAESDEEGDAALAAAVGHALALQQADAEAEAEAAAAVGQEEGVKEGEGKAGGVTAAIGRMMSQWGLAGAESFVVVDREGRAAPPAPPAPAQAELSKE